MSSPLGTRDRLVSPQGAAGRGDTTVNGVPDPDTPTILVAEDEPAVRAWVGKVLRTQGYQVLEAVDGAEALEMAERQGGPIHLLLTDLAMPRLDGRELWRHLNRQRPETRALFMSSFQVVGLHPEAAFLSKPIGARVLVRKVREVLQFPVQRRTALKRTPRERRSSHGRSRAAGT